MARVNRNALRKRMAKSGQSSFRKMDKTGTRLEGSGQQRDFHDTVSIPKTIISRLVPTMPLPKCV